MRNAAGHSSGRKKEEGISRFGWKRNAGEPNDSANCHRSCQQQRQ